ncbi:ATP synthase subunit I [Desulfonema ishimotonii]|uniref:ATP synthase subunit I n=1 Tax=Desulfonema ishimotonii TaxID=45657 RepID=A0A401G4L4_9BACT|nr:ATP synthase subunit I [Desulfonema ishimotonii]GBC64154.1 ATP synthase subunit I [Desulfonema ishimotonii]
MNIQHRLLKFVTVSNWLILAIAGAVSFLTASSGFTAGLICGGLIVTINFHLLYRTLKKALTPSHLSSHNVILAKYYVRFIVSGLIIFFLISNHYVNPIGLFVGLSVVVVSIMLATVFEFRNLFFKEAM